MERLYVRIYAKMERTITTARLNAYHVVQTVLHVQIYQLNAHLVGLQTLGLFYFWMAISVFNSVD